jgi:putative redox protein
MQEHVVEAKAVLAKWSSISGATACHHAQGAYRLERKISVEGELTAEQRAALLRVAQACPVYKTLTGDIAVNTSLAWIARGAVPARLV